jgi:hypothetical protein
MQTATDLPKRTPAGISHAYAGLLCDVRHVLWASGYAELHQIEIEIHQRQVFLRGTVSSYFQKQLAQEFVKRIPGVAGLQNEIRVVRSAKGRAS